MLMVRGRGLMMTALALLTLAALVTSQITFSRDWTGGKRSAPVALDCGQFARMCRHFLREMKTAMAAVPEAPSKRRRVGGESPPTYEDE